VRLALVALTLGFLAIGAGAVAGTIAAIGDAAEVHDPVIPAGARVAGLDVGGRRLSEAAALIDKRFAVRLRSPLHVRAAGRVRTLTADSVGLRFDALRSARRANIAARRAGDPATVNVRLWVRYSDERLARFVSRVASVVARRPRNARLRYVVSRLAIRGGRAGYDIDRRKLRARIEHVLQTPDASRILRAKRRRVAPHVTRADMLRKHPVVVTIHRRGFRLRVFRRAHKVASYRVAVGMPGHRTPRGRFKITSKAKNPAWSAPDQAWAGAYRNEVVEGGAPDNPLKARWLGIVNGVGIHGTSAIWSLGHAASHGCIRMAVPAVERVCRLVPIGAPVLIK
jgi:lipoprotein-anchoring transpeptidase ErfK/SrfK